MGDHPLGLIDDHDVGILVKNIEVECNALQGFRLGNLPGRPDDVVHANGLASFAGGGGVDGDVAQRNLLLHENPASPGLAGEKLIEAVLAGFDGKGEDGFGFNRLL